jgi:hypothetical protein
VTLFSLLTSTGTFQSFTFTMKNVLVLEDNEFAWIHCSAKSVPILFDFVYRLSIVLYLCYNITILVRWPRWLFFIADHSRCEVLFRIVSHCFALFRIVSDVSKVILSPSRTAVGITHWTEPGLSMIMACVLVVLMKFRFISTKDGFVLSQRVGYRCMRTYLLPGSWCTWTSSCCSGKQ